MPYFEGPVVMLNFALNPLTRMTPIVEPVVQQFGLALKPAPIDVPDVPMCLMTRDTRYDPLSKWLLNLAQTVFR